MKECKECYTSYARITPLLKPRECLEHHTQYICSTCGRCICVNRTEKSGLQRWSYPFKSLEIAKLYLRGADVTEQTACGIYEITDGNGRFSYKIFSSEAALNEYLGKHKKKLCISNRPVYQRFSFVPSPNAEIRRLKADEIETYVKEQLESVDV